MKTLLQLGAFLSFILAALSIPLSIVLGIWDWSVNDSQFKDALWFAVKSWLSLAAGGLTVGVLCSIASDEDDR